MLKCPICGGKKVKVEGEGSRAIPEGFPIPKPKNHRCVKCGYLFSKEEIERQENQNFDKAQ